MKKNSFQHLAAALLAKRWRLPALCYALAVVFLLAGATLRLAMDTWDRGGGRLTTTALSLEDFTLVNAHITGPDSLVSENEDPQLHYTASAGQRLSRLTVHIAYDRYPYERCLYYTTRAGEEFGQEKRVWATQNPDGSLTFQLPRGVLAIRLDPGSCNDLGMVFSQITLNAPRAAVDYYLPSGGGWFALAVVPALLAAALQWVLDFCNALTAGKKATDRGTKAP